MKSLMVYLTQKMEYIVEEIPWLYKFFQRYYDKVVENEIKLANIKATDKILCIGGGPCPCTAIELHRKTGANVCVIDNDKEVICSAIKNIDKLDLSDFISVEFLDGAEIDAHDFSVVHIALQVNPKATVFQRIVNSSRPGTKIMVRMANERFSKLYSMMKSEYIKIDNKVHHNKKNLDYTLLHVTGGINEEILDPYNSTATCSIAI